MKEEGAFFLADDDGAKIAGYYHSVLVLDIVPMQMSIGDIQERLIDIIDTNNFAIKLNFYANDKQQEIKKLESEASQTKKIQEAVNKKDYKGEGKVKNVESLLQEIIQGNEKVFCK